MSTKKALSLRRVKAMAKKGRKGDPGLDAMWSAGAWMLPVQVVLLVAGGAEGGAAVLVTLLGVLLMFVAAPFVAAFFEGAGAPAYNALGWAFALAAAASAWGAVVGVIPAAVGVAAGAGLFAAMLRRHKRRLIGKSHPRELPLETARRIAAFPENLPKALRRPLDAALAAHQSLVALVESPALADGDVDAEGMRTDALACIDQIVDRTHNALRLRELPTQSDAVERSRQKLADQVDQLSASLTAAVDAAATYVAVGASEAAKELAARAEHLHDVSVALTALNADDDA